MSDRGSRDAQLIEAIERARQSSFYARHLDGHELKTADDLARLPLTFKKDLTESSPDGLLIVPRNRAWHYHETSGTTGQPIATWCGLPEVQEMGRVVSELVPELQEPTMLLNRFPLFAPVSFVFEEAMRHVEGCHIAAGNLSWDVPFRRVLDFIQRLEVTALSSLPLEPILLREVAEENALDMKRDLGSLRVIFLGGAILPPALRKRIESDWGARVVEIYGSNETLLMGVGCSAGQLHLSEELLQFEILDPDTKQPVADGEAGVVTVTSLVHTVAPLVRYYSGDFAKLNASPCSCGRPGKTAEVLGRLDDALQRDGKILSHYEILDAGYELVADLGARIFFVVVQESRLRFLVELEALDPGRRESAEKKLRERVGEPVEVQYLAENEVLDRSALFRTPKIYKPSQISDWRNQGRQTVTIMEALLEWPNFDGKTLWHLAKRQVGSAMRRRRFARED